MICSQCQRAGTKATETFTNRERIFLLTATATMMKFLAANPNAPADDKMVGSSVTTKLLLSLPESGRGILLQQLRQSAGIDITMGSCPHGIASL